MHRATLDEIERNPGEQEFSKSGRWVWSHDAERYANKNYHACLKHLQTGALFENTNLPPGHIYKPWSLQLELSRIKAGVPSDLKRNGDWSA